MSDAIKSSGDKSKKKNRTCFLCGTKTWSANAICPADKDALQDWFSHKGEYACNMWFERSDAETLRIIKASLPYYRSKDWKIIRHEALGNVHWSLRRTG